LPPPSPLSRASQGRRPVRPGWCVSSSAGVNDITARLIGHWLSERMGQNFLIDNRSGAAGNIGTEAVVRAPADGKPIADETKKWAKVVRFAGIKAD
jgi:tripartite-type tricarboxylate transporter receptor subunit TctC